MSTKIAQILLRQDTYANWESEDPILGSGELGVDTDNGIIKYGDGTTAWSSLPVIDRSHTISDTDERTAFDLGSGTFYVTSSVAVSRLNDDYGPYAIRSWLEDSTLYAWKYDLPGMRLDDEMSNASSIASELLIALRIYGDHTETYSQYPGSHVTYPNKVIGGTILINNVYGDVAYQNLVVLGNYEVSSTQVTDGQVTYTPVYTKLDNVVYEVWSRVLWKNPADLSMMNVRFYQSHWKLSNASYDIYPTYTAITDAEIAAIVGVNVQYANGQSF